jgi:transposase
LVGVSKHTLYAWKKRFEEEGPAGLMDRPRGVAKGSKLPDLTKRDPDDEGGQSGLGKH